MKLPHVAATAAVVVGSALAFGQAPTQAPAPAPAQGGSELKDLKAKVAYSFGLNLARNFKTQGVDLDPDVIAKGMKDGLAGGKLQLTDAEARQAMQEFQQQLQAKQAEMNEKRMAEAAKAGQTAKKDGEAFLAANKSKPDVVTLPSGLQYKVIKEGTGPQPKATDTVQVNYTGKLLNDEVFDASEKHGGPATFPLNRVIKGWTEGVQQMKVGAKYQFYIPSELAYGPSGSPPSIPPHSTLIFDIELLKIGE